MKCDRLISLIKNWYLKVQEEAMAPARMVAFMEQHISQCEECLADPDVRQEADKIREIVLPPSKVPKAKVVRVPKEDIVAAEEADKDQAPAEDEAVATEEGETPAEDEAVATEEGEASAEDEVDDDDDDDEDDNGFNPDLLVEDDEI
jgi:hypothetical protein